MFRLIWVTFAGLCCRRGADSVSDHPPPRKVAGNGRPPPGWWGRRYCQKRQWHTEHTQQSI